MKKYSQKIYDAVLAHLLHPDKDYTTYEYHARYCNLFMMVYDEYGHVNETLCREYQDAENRAEEILNSPVMKAMK